MSFVVSVSATESGSALRLLVSASILFAFVMISGLVGCRGDVSTLLGPGRGTALTDGDWSASLPLSEVRLRLLRRTEDMGPPDKRLDHHTSPPEAGRAGRDPLLAAPAPASTLLMSSEDTAASPAMLGRELLRDRRPRSEEASELRDELRVSA